MYFLINITPSFKGNPKTNKSTIKSLIGTPVKAVQTLLTVRI